MTDIDPQQSVGERLNVPSDTPADDELKTALAELEVLPFRDDGQKSAFFETVQRLQARHVIQCFKFGVAERKNSFIENSQFCEEVINIFEICFSSCYTADVEKRIAFDYFATALTFCFPEHSSQCLSTAILSKLLQLVQIFQAGKLATIVCDNTQMANPNLRIKGAKSLFEEVLAILQTRRDQGHLAEIVDQTIRFASKDASISCIGEQVPGRRSEHVVTPVLLSNWVRLLKFEHVSNDFACALAKMDDPRCTKQHQLVLHPYSPVPLLQPINVYESKVCYFAEVLENLKSSNIAVTLPLDEERLRILCGHIHHFNCDSSPPSLRMTSLKLFANISVSNGVLKGILDQYFKDGPSLPNLKINEQSLQPEFPQADAFELVFEALKLYPDGRLVNRLLQFWKENVPGNQDYIALSHLIGLLLQGSKSEKQSHLAESAAKTVDFVVSTCLLIPQSLKPLVTLWCPFLASFLKIFPESYQSRQDVLVHLIKKAQELINKADERLEDDFFCSFYLDLRRPIRPCKLGMKAGEDFDDGGDELRLILNFLEWIAQQCCTEEMKGEMMFLLMSCILDKISSIQDFQFSVYVIKQLSLGQHKNFIIKKELIRNFIGLAKLFKEREVKNVFQEVVKGLASDQNLKLKDEIFSEILYLVRRCSIAKTIPPDTLQLFSLVSSCPLSGDRRVKVLQRSKKSGKGLSCGLQILQLVKRRPHLVMKEENKYFDLLFSAFFGVLREDKDMCLQFYTQQLSVLNSPQVIVHLCCSEVPRLISSGMFQEIESQWCLPVFQHAPEVNSPTEMLALYFQVRESAVKVVERVAENPGNEVAFQQQTFISSLLKVVESNVLTFQEKLSLVEKVCDTFVRDPSNLTKETVVNVLCNMIPFSQLQNDDKTINKDVMRLELNEIEAILENPAIMSQLSRLPIGLNNSLCSLFSTMTSGYCSSGKLADIYNFIGSQEHLDEAFFDNVVAILKVAAEESNSVKNFIELLKEVVTFVQGVSSELDTFIMDSFRYLLENRVPKQERTRFLSDVVLNWGFLPKFPILSYLEVPRLLWIVYSSIADTPKRCELIDRVQFILQKTTNLQTLCNTLSYDHIRRRIACCDLELLVLNSSLSIDEAVLAYELSSSLSRHDQRLRCFTFSDVHIHEGCFKFIAHETWLETESSSRDEILNAGSAEGNKGSSSLAIESEILTPATIALKMIEHVKRTLRKGEDLAEVVSLLWNLSFGHKRFFCRDECAKSLTLCDDYLKVFLSIVSEASSTEIMLHWAKVDSHYVYQCSEVILMACKKRCEADDNGKEDLLKFQAVVSATLEKMRTTQSQTIAPVWHRDPCFLLVKPQLKHLIGILERRFSISVQTQILNLFQTNMPAAVTLADVVSSWSNQDQVRRLVDSMHLFCQEEELPSQSEFVWQLLKAFGRFCLDSSDSLMAKFKELLLLRDPQDEYGFNRLPKWREKMIASGFSSHVIDFWCVAFLTTPFEELSSRDVDAIVDLNSNSQQIGSAIFEEINSCIFPEHDFGGTITLERGIKEPSTKERLRLARLLGEFINMLRLRKPEESRKDAVIKQIVVEACDKLCKAYKREEKKRPNGGDLYMIHEDVLKALFTEVFGKQYKSDAGVDSGGEASPAVNAESRGQSCVTRQSSYLHENLPHILRHNEVFEPLLVLLRRWLSRSAVKPTLASHTQGVVQQIFSIHSAVEQIDRKSARVAVDPELHRKIQAHILSLEENQTLIAQLQASGYNQTTQGTQSLWSSSTLEVSGYISKRESADSKRFLKKMTQNLRILWDEWKHILFALGKGSVKVDGTEVRTRDLFSLQTTLEVMEKQVSAVKEAVNQIELGDLKRRVKQLMRKEQRCRERTEKLYKSKARNSCFFFLFYFIFQILFIDLVLNYS